MNTPTTESNILCLENVLERLLFQSLESNYQIAIWRSPKSNMVQVIIDKSDKVKKVALDLEDLPKGFIIHPFETKEASKAYFLEADAYFNFDINLSHFPEEELGQFHSINLNGDQIKEKIRQNLRIKSKNSGNKTPLFSTTKEDFIKIVNDGISSIQTGNITKVVPARVKTIPFRENFDLANTFLELCSQYPNGFVNFFHIPEVGTWLGASPEILINTEGNCFNTMALAGTQKAEGDNPIKSAAWTQKEIEEQALVSRYIVNNFKKIRLREYEEVGPKTVLAGNLLHLRSDFRVDMKSTNFPQLGSVMLKLLHPTSAVCGSPRENAMNFLKEKEKFDRSFFSGFLGPVNIQGQTSIFVNLRTAQIMGDQIALFAGAGVTEDSTAEKEWEETNLKCNIIGKFIQ
ncbi:chorismate-binding protein [Echinicola jeungdonensis]|uniref:Chorismate-binding protein n=1 Tax=Echinicola jeungdonensis TaxID=709343 RepID=A0ABV5J5V0_9BACT|nr:chorismate-binding protein [Echinicola jeungdonensis]MDN3670099.1 chorismate-binding protein [Echinicola jeungdonensis]